MNLLGINAYHGDVSAVLLVDGQLVAAVEEERFRRIKHVAGFPYEAIRSCLKLGGLAAADIDHVAVSRNPKAHLWRKAAFAIRHRPSGLLKDRAANYRQVNRIPDLLAEELGWRDGARRPAVHWVEHHPAHLASAFFVSPFDEAAVCAVDGFGDFVSTSIAHGRGNRIDVRQRTYFPHSLGVFYLALTQYLGFPDYGDEFKVMGLAPYGTAAFRKELSALVRLMPGGRFELDLSYFRHWTGDATMTWTDGVPVLAPVFADRLERLLGPARKPGEPLTDRHEAIAASLQAVYEDAFFHVLNGLHARIPATTLCLAGGCAMNSVANGKIALRTPFERVFIQPAAGDNGTALGAAFWVWHQVLKQRRNFVMTHAFWGPDFDDASVERELAARATEIQAEGCEVCRFQDTYTLTEFTADRLARGQVIGWFQGRMEWGARALGNRSILADPRRADMREIINTKIKFREKFRPFAPAILDEGQSLYFATPMRDPFMMHVLPVHEDKRTVVPAVTHVDGSGRLQTVDLDTNPLFWELIRAFQRRADVPMLLNTSFNENEPIVHTPGEAIDCFLRTDMDALVLGKTVVRRPGREARQ